MTFAELVLLTLTAVGIYLALRPVQHRLERKMLHWLGGRKRGGAERPVIDITEESRKRSDK